MYNNPFGYNPYYQPINNQPNFTAPNTANNQISAVNSAVNNRQALNGKLVDSVDVVKAIDIPLDGSVSYFPLADNSAIVTKQLKSDGTSKTMVYKPVEEEKQDFKFVTADDLKKSIESIDLSEIDDLKDEIKELKAEIKKIKKGD